MKFQEYKIEKNYKSIYYFLKDKHFSENYISNLRKKLGNFILNDNPVNIRATLSQGDILKINSSPNEKTTIMQCIIPLNIVYEDEYYLLVNKESGISCMPNKRHYNHNLAGAICNYMSKKDEEFVLRMINRLDKDTSGLILIAKDSISQNKISNIEKTYYAICEGKIEHDICIDKPIKTINDNGINLQKRMVADDGQPASTFVHPILTTSKCSLLEIKLLHGRTHQIRVHLSHIGHPLLGDALYGNKCEEINHAALVCKEISFYHYILEKQLYFKIDFPADIQYFIDNYLKKSE